MPLAQILVIDDNQDIRNLATMVLESEGYAVHTAPDGEAALTLLNTLVPDLILLDLLMPVMDGWDFLDVYRGHPGPYAPIILFAAQRTFGERADVQGIAAILDKPFDLDVFLELVAAVLHGQPVEWQDA